MPSLPQLPRSLSNRLRSPYRRYSKGLLTICTSGGSEKRCRGVEDDASPTPLQGTGPNAEIFTMRGALLIISYRMGGMTWVLAYGKTATPQRRVG